MTQILPRATSMPVVEAQDQMLVEPDTVYVIPPNRDMSIFHHKLQLSVTEVPRSRRMPIDAFLRSLAEDCGESAIGVVLSGTGTDGTLGLRAILGAGGVTVVQDPLTAKFDGMPSSAIAAGYAMHVLPPEQIGAALVLGERTLPSVGDDGVKLNASLARLLMHLRTATGHDFSQYKKTTILRRIERRMSQHNLTDLDVYARYLRENPPEAQALFRELLINVTSFFRDPDAFQVLAQEVLPAILQNKPEDYVLRVWVAGCATGEEAYSLAMLFREAMEGAPHAFKVQMYATDLDDDAIAVARAGLYPPNIVTDVTPERLRRFFLKEDAGYRVKKEVREMVVFAVQNIIKDPPFTKLDLLTCRNVLIYLEPALQARLIPAFHYALKSGGVLFLSPSESVGNHVELFTAMNRKWKFYTAERAGEALRTLMTGGLAWTAEPNARVPESASKKPKELSVAEVTRRVLLQSYAPASVVTDPKGTILFVHGETGKYLRPPPGQATLNVVEMARDGLQLELRIALQQVVERGIAASARETVVKLADGESSVLLNVRPLVDPDAIQGMLLVSFTDIAPTRPKRRARTTRQEAPDEDRRIADLERDLAYTRENLQATIEEQQASNEELKSTNEELQSTNEELQSTNEELETSKEELQSVNEELITVNAELQAKIEQLGGVQNDMKNLFDNINVGTVFLDRNLTIRRFTREAMRVYRLVGTDVGRPLADIKSDLAGDDLTGAARQVLETLVPYEREVQAGGASYLARVQPYRTLDDVIEGVVLTFTDISKRMAAEAAERKARHLAGCIVDTVTQPLLVLDGAMRVVSASQAYYRRFAALPKETVGRNFFELGRQRWNLPPLRELLETVLPRDEAFDGLVIEQEFPNVGTRKLVLNARRIVGDPGDTPLILLVMEEQGGAQT